MNNLSINPFKFGDPVKGDTYLPRPELNKFVGQLLENGMHVLLIGPPRYGKTSFLLDLLQEFENESTLCLYIDIFNITSHHDFLQQILRSIRTKKGWKEILKEWMDLIPHIRPKISADFDVNSGQPSLGLTLNQVSAKDVKEMIQDVLVRLESLGDKVIVAFDEFQKITEINDEGWLEETLRTHMQRLKNTTFLFTGSRRRIINDMFNNQLRSFYRSCQPIEFPAFGEEFTDWIEKRFSNIGISSQREAIHHLRELVQDSPNYVQMACFHLVAQGKKSISKEDVENVLHKVVQQNSYAYQSLFGSFTPTEQEALKFSAVNKIEVAATPALASAIKALKNKGILDEEGSGKGNIIFDDPLFAIWLKLQC